MEVRTARPDEYAALGDLTVAAYEALEPGRLGTYANELRDVAARADGVEVLVATDSGRVLGGVSYVPGPGSPGAEFDDPDAAGIRMLAVAGDARRRGVGAALTQACIDRAVAAGRRQIVLHSTDRMVDAHRLYLRLGFERDPSIDWEPEPDFWLRGFRLRLSPPC
jgi:GNAT superfamily N-acetyltransferase